MTSAAIKCTQAILNALKPSQSAGAWSSDLARQAVDWNDLVVRSIVLGLAPQLHHRFTEWGLKPPQKASAKLAVTHRAQTSRNADIYDQLAEFLSLCQARKLSPVALKGVHLATDYYAQPGLRPMNDIDLLFRPEEIAQAEAILVDLGYGGKYKSPETGAGVTKHTSTYRRPEAGAGATSNPYLSASSGRTIEPHSSLEESWYGLRVDITPGIWQRTVKTQLAGCECLVLGPEDLLLHLCLHLCFHLIEGAPSMVQLSDLLVVTQKGGIDWDMLVERAEQQRASPYVLAGLSMAQKLLEAPVPEIPLQKLARLTPPGLRRRIGDLVLADLLRRTQRKPLTSLGQRLRRGWHDRAETARWAADWRGRWQVWRTVLRPWQSDTGQLLQQAARSPFSKRNEV